MIPPTVIAAGHWTSVARMIGRQDSILVADPQGRIIFAKHAEKRLIPASTLKLLTSLVALQYLGPGYRFTTEFHLDENSNLKIKGCGDPLLISEVMSGIALGIKPSLALNANAINDIVLDDSYFQKPVRIPGIASCSAQPYDAPNGALCANFNSIAFKQDGAHSGIYVSDEPQTPLLPFVLGRVKASGLAEGRIILSDRHDEHTLYTGHLLRHFLEQQGVAVRGGIRLGKVDATTGRLMFRYTSQFPLTEVISRLLAFSNNFIANQLLISVGAKVFGPPGTLAKGIRATALYAESHPQLKGVTLAEGSGLSRKNRVTAKMLHAVLEEFVPHYQLMRHNGREYYKTGTLSGIRTRAGYFENVGGKLYRYVVMVNTPGKSAEKIVRQVMKTCAENRKASGLANRR